MATIEKDLTADGYLAKIMQNPSVLGYIIFNNEGIPMRYDGAGITHKVAVHYTALVSDYWQVARKVVQKQLKDSFNSLGKPGLGGGPSTIQADNDIEHIRMRTAKNTELIITAHGEFTMVCIQKCKSMVDGMSNEADEDKKSIHDAS